MPCCSGGLCIIEREDEKQKSFFFLCNCVDKKPAHVADLGLCKNPVR